jgi:hypothetical protein
VTRKRGRKSLSELTVPQPFGGAVRIELLAAPPELTPPQAQVWEQVVAAMPADWSTPEVWPALMRYCRHIVEARRIAQMIDVETARADDVDLDRFDQLLQVLERQSAKIKALATTLRLSPQSRIGPRTAARAFCDMSNGRRPWQVE